MGKEELGEYDNVDEKEKGEGDLIKHDVIKLKVPVDDSVLVEEQDSDGDFCTVEPVKQKRSR